MSDLGFLEKLLDGAEVGWKPLGSVARILNGFACKSSMYSETGIRVVRISDVQKGKMSNKDLKFYPLEAEREIKRYILKADDLVMSLTGNCGRVAMLSDSDLPAALNQRVACLRPNRDLVLTRYLFHFFDQLSFEQDAMSNATGGGQQNMSTTWLGAYRVPIPCPEDPEKSLAIQGEIVRILDSFTELTAELTAELAARKKQYNHYRESLFTFAPEEADFLALGDERLGEFIRGGGLQKKDFVEAGVGCIHYGQIYTHYGTFTHSTKSFVTAEFARKARMAKQGNLVIATTSENDDDVCKAVAWLGEGDIAVSSDACFYTHNLNPKYVAYFFQTEQFQKQKRAYITGTKVRRVNADSLAKIVVPVPKKEDEQARIAAILDKFDTLTTSLSEGLPREIALRQQQYEYYRDQLLRFPKPAEAVEA